MVEVTPRSPYGSTVKDMMDIERSLQLRRKRLHSRLTADEIAPSISIFPMIGVSGYPHTINRDGQVNNISNSQYISDRVINPHPRFGALTHNIRLRRSSNINISVPLETEPSSQLRRLDSSISKSTEDVEETEDDDDDDDTDDGHAPNAVHMDAMAFGMGCCCLQVTIQTRDELESRYLTDQLSILSPLLHALSAATPIIKGRLLATDTRWDIISQSVDDRTPTELDPTGGTVPASAITADDPPPPLVCGDPMMAGNGSSLQTQSRYSQIPLYIARASSAGDVDRLDHLNDLRVSMDDTAYSMLVGEEGRVDPILARYIAHLFTR
jgi:glutamate--cysteine ligase catalytic subunit